MRQQFASGWQAFTVTVNNRTNQHVFLSDANDYVPPGIYKATIPLPGVTQAQAEFKPPPSVRDVPGTTGQIAILDFYEEELAPASGVLGGLGALPVGQAPTPFKISLTVAGGAVGVIFAAVSTIQRVLFNGFVAVDAVEAGTIFSICTLAPPDPGSYGSDFALFTHGVLQQQPFDFNGAPLPVDLGIGIKNYGVNPHVYSGVFSIIPAA